MSASSTSFVWLHESLSSPPINSGGTSLAARSHVQTGKTKRRRGLGRSKSTSKIVQEGWRVPEQYEMIERGIDGTDHGPPSDFAAEQVDTVATSESFSSSNSASQPDYASLVNEEVEVDFVHPPSLPAQPAIPPSESAMKPKHWSNVHRSFHHVPAPSLRPRMTNTCGTMPITIDEGVRRILSFVRDIWFPTWIPDGETSVRSTLSITEWDSMTGCLENPSSAYALLSMYATLLAKKTADPEDIRHSLRYKHQSLISLRAQLGQKNSNSKKKLVPFETSATSPSSSTLLQASMTFLLGAAIWMDSLAEAEMHLRALKEQFESDSTNATAAEQTNIIRAMRFDVRLAMLRHTPTIFDMESQVPMLLQRTFERGNRFFDTVPGFPFTCTLDARLRDILRSMLLRSRQGFWLWRQTRLKMKSDDIVVLTNWVMGHHFIIQGRLLNFFLEMTPQLLLQDSQDQNLATETRVDLCLALGILCVHNDATNWGVSGHESTVVLLQDLQDLLKQIECANFAFSASNSFKCETILLWCLFIGTLSARRHTSKRLECWFSKRLMANIQRAGLTECEEVQSLLELFLYFEEMTPFLRRWFAKNIMERQ